MNDNLIAIAASIAVSLSLYFLNKASKQKVHALNNGQYALRMNRMYQMVGATGILLSNLVLLIPILAKEYSTEIFIATGMLFLFIIGLSLPCFLWYRNHNLLFDETQIISTDVYGKEQKVEWTNIQSIRFRSFLGVLEIMDNQDKVVKAHRNLVGFSTFVSELKRQSNKYNFGGDPIPVD